MVFFVLFLIVLFLLLVRKFRIFLLFVKKFCSNFFLFFVILLLFLIIFWVFLIILLFLFMILCFFMIIIDFFMIGLGEFFIVMVFIFENIFFLLIEVCCRWGELILLLLNMLLDLFIEFRNLEILWLFGVEFCVDILFGEKWCVFMIIIGFLE